MYVIPNFDERDKEKEIVAYDQIKNMPRDVLYFHLKVFQSFYVLLIIICRNIVMIPFFFFKSKGDKSPQAKNVKSFIISMLCSFTIIYGMGLDFDSGLELMKIQTIYKLWAVYALFQIIIKFMMKVHAFTHKIIRGAIRQEKSLILPILLHSFSTCLLFGCYSIYNGCYLSGLYGKKNIMFSAAIHIQAIIAKKYLPKVLETPPAINEPINLIVLLLSIIDHLRIGNLYEIKDIIIYQFACLFIRFFLTTLTEDSPKFYKSLSEGVNSIYSQFQGNSERTDSSLMLGFPSEVFSVSLLFLLVQGPFINSIFLLIFILLISFIGPILIPKPKQEQKVNKEEKDKKNCKKN